MIVRGTPITEGLFSAGCGVTTNMGGSADNTPIADIFEIDCNLCGKYEYRQERTREPDAAEQSVLKLRRR